MRISIFTTLGNIGNTPDYWQYAWREAIQSYLDFADEVIVVCGDRKTANEITKAFPTPPIIKYELMDWEYDFSWETIAQHFNAGLEACTGDWIIKMDIDYIIHEQYMKDFRDNLDLAIANDFELASYMKTTVLNKDKYYLKLAVPFCIRKEFRDKYKFGIPLDDNKSAWGYPILVDGGEKNGLPTGKSLPDINDVAFRTGVEILNYDNTFRNKEITAEHFLRFSNARAKAGFKREWGSTKEEALAVFIEMFRSRLKKTRGGIAKRFDKTGGHPKYIQERINNLTPDLFGYDNWQ